MVIPSSARGSAGIESVKRRTRKWLSCARATAVEPTVNKGGASTAQAPMNSRRVSEFALAGVATGRFRQARVTRVRRRTIHAPARTIQSKRRTASPKRSTKKCQTTTTTSTRFGVYKHHGTPHIAEKSAIICPAIKTLTRTRHSLLFVRRMATTHQAASNASDSRPSTHENQNQNMTRPYSGLHGVQWK